MFDWLVEISLWLLGLLLFAVLVLAILGGYALRRRNDRIDASIGECHNDTQEGYIVSAVLTLLGLLIGFTFALAVDRYEERRLLVIDGANAVETLYLRAQLLDEPHRTRISTVTTLYTENQIRLANAEGTEGERLLERNHHLIRMLWTVTVPAFDTIRGIDFSSSFVDSVNQVIALDTARKANRRATIPGPVFAVLFVYTIVAAGILGYVLIGRRGRVVGSLLLGLFILALLLLGDFNRPISGVVNESQEPMERVLAAMRASPPGTFEGLRTLPSTLPAPPE